MIPQDSAGFWVVTKAHPSAHIELCAGGRKAGDRQKDKPDEELFFAAALIPISVMFSRYGELCPSSNSEAC
jgi:hypothetical protein